MPPRYYLARQPASSQLPAAGHRHTRRTGLRCWRRA